MRQRSLRPIAMPLIALALCWGAADGAAQGVQPRKTSSPAPSRGREDSVRAKLNTWTLGLAGGLLEGAPIRFAVEMARVADSGDDLHVLPIVTRGPTENVEALLYLRGVDVAIVNTDVLEHFKPLVPNVKQLLTSVLTLFPSEVHILVRPEIGSLQDLAGKKVNFNTAGTAAAYSGPLIFERLGVKAEKTFIPHQTALEQMRKGEMAGVVFVTSKPVDALARAKWEPGFKLLAVPYDGRFQDYYLPASLSATDYPGLVEAGSEVKTISVPTFLAAYNWPKNSQRYGRLSRFVETLFQRIDRLQAPGFHPKWKDVNIAAGVPGLARSYPAQAWLDRMDAQEGSSAATASHDPARKGMAQQRSRGAKPSVDAAPAPGGRQ